MRTTTFLNQVGIGVMSGAIALLGWSGAAIAQSTNVVFDGTLVNEAGAVLNPAIASPTGANITIPVDNGLIREANLLHSFGEFNLFDGGQVTFASEAGIRNIISRVTGGNLSFIDGTLATNGGVENVFLINPSGIIFGDDAQLRIPNGSFWASTADTLNFSGGGQFIASSTQPGASLLSISGDPSGFLASLRTPGEIQVEGRSNRDLLRSGVLTELPPAGESGLAVSPGRSLVLLGGDVTIDGGGLVAEPEDETLTRRRTLLAPGGRIEIGSLAGLNQVIDINLDLADGVAAGQVGNLQDALLTSASAVDQGTVTIQNGAILDVTNVTQGNIAIQGNTITVDNSALCAGIGPSPVCGREFAAVNDPNSLAGNIFLGAVDQVTVRNGSRIENDVNNATGNLRRSFANSSASDLATDLFGSVVVSADVIAIGSGSTLSTSTFGNGNAGAVLLLADAAIAIANGRILSTATAQSVGGDSGGVLMSTPNLRVSDGSVLSTDTSSQGDAGIVFINAGDFTLDAALISSNVSRGASGDALGVAIETNTLNVLNGAQIQSLTQAAGEAGTVLITADESVRIAGTAPFGTGGFGAGGFSSGILVSNELGSTATGSEGLIQIEAPLVSIADGGVLSARSLSAADGGDILVIADRLELLNGGQILALSLAGDRSSQAGNVFVIAEDVLIDGRDDTLSRRFEQTLAQSLASELLARLDALAAEPDRSFQNSLAVDAINTTLGTFDNVLPDSVELIFDLQYFVTQEIFVNTFGSDFATDPALLDRFFTTWIDRSLGVLVEADPTSFLAFEAFLRSDFSQVFTTQYNQAFAAFAAQYGANFRQDPGLNAAFTTTVIQQTALNAPLGSTGLINNNNPGSGIFANASLFSLAQGGNIGILANRIGLRDGAQISTQTQSGIGGDISIQARLVIALVNRGNISTTAGRSFILATGDGGNISIATQIINAQPIADSNITAQAVFGTGGAVTLRGFPKVRLKTIALREDDFSTSNDITVTSRFGLTGSTLINDLEIDPVRESDDLPRQVIDVSNLVAEGCAAGNIPDNRNLGELFVTGRGGLPPDLATATLTDTTFTDLADLPTAAPGTGATSPSPTPEQAALDATLPSGTPNWPDAAVPALTPTPPVIEAQGFVQAADGSIALAANLGNATPVLPIFTPVVCDEPS